MLLWLYLAIWNCECVRYNGTILYTPLIDLHIYISFGGIIIGIVVDEICVKYRLDRCKFIDEYKGSEMFILRR